MLVLPPETSYLEEAPASQPYRGISKEAEDENVLSVDRQRNETASERQIGNSSGSVVFLDSSAGLWFTVDPRGLLGPGGKERRGEVSVIGRKELGSGVISCLSLLFVL